MTLAHRRPRRNLNLRLDDLESFYAAAIAAAHGPSDKERADAAIAKVREIIASRGVVQGPNESLMETLARALGVSTQELRAYLLERSFIHAPADITAAR